MQSCMPDKEHRAIWGYESPKLFVFFTKFFPHQTALTHNYVMIRSSRRDPKGDKSSNSAAWWEYSAALWSDGTADGLAIWLPQKRCNNSKIHTRVSYSGNRDGDSSLWLRSIFSFFRRGPQLICFLQALCGMKKFFKPLRGKSAPSRKKFSTNSITPSPYKW